MAYKNELKLKVELAEALEQISLGLLSTTKKELKYRIGLAAISLQETWKKV